MTNYWSVVRVQEPKVLATTREHTTDNLLPAIFVVRDAALKLCDVLNEIAGRKKYEVLRANVQVAVVTEVTSFV